ncbi:MAG TPA: hypothetical protein VD794_11305 [Flavisolibacter sp.]|nr:hypothetical protein [Flavisolibacter sp.]
MDKQPLYSIETLFQQKLEELPVDTSLQHEQWLLLSKTMHKQPGGFRSQLHKPMVKLFYMTAVALVPFGVFFVFTKKGQVESSALNYSGGNVTRSLLVLNQTKQIIQAKKSRIVTPVATVPIAKETHPITSGYSERSPEQNCHVIGSQPVKHKDSVQAMPAKPEKPLVKKADSSYIYWQ